MDGACGGSNGHLTAIRHRSGRSTGGVGYYVEGGAFYDAPNDPDEQKLTAELKFAKKTATVMTYEQYFRREKCAQRARRLSKNLRALDLTIPPTPPTS